MGGGLANDSSIDGPDGETNVDGSWPVSGVEYEWLLSGDVVKWAEVASCGIGVACKWDTVDEAGAAMVANVVVAGAAKGNGPTKDGGRGGQSTASMLTELDAIDFISFFEKDLLRSGKLSVGKTSSSHALRINGSDDAELELDDNCFTISWLIE